MCLWINLRNNWDVCGMPHHPLPLAQTAGTFYMMWSTIKQLRPLVSVIKGFQTGSRHTDTIGPPLEQKRMARLDCLNKPSTNNLDKLKSNVPLCNILWEMQSTFWEDVCCKLQNCNDWCDIAGVNMALKHALVPTPHLTMELKDPNGNTQLERSDKLKCWTEHFTQLYGTEVPFEDQALDSLDQMPVTDNLDNHPNLSKVISAWMGIQLGKGSGSDGIPPDTETLTYLT